MPVNPDSPVAVLESTAKKDPQPGRQLLNITGWLVFLTVVILTFRPGAFYELLNFQNTPIPSASVIAGRPNPHIGPLDAPVTIVEFGDFACPACSSWNESGILKKVMDKYGDQVRFVWADFPSVSPDSFKAAEAARCAYDQGKFWEYHDYLFSHMEALRVNNLKIFAGLLGLERTQFDPCLDAETRKAEILLDYQDALSRQIGTIPTFIIQTRIKEMSLMGPPSYDDLVLAIDTIRTPTP